MSKKKKAASISRKWSRFHKLWNQAKSKSEKAIAQATKLFTRRERALEAELEKAVNKVLKTGCVDVGAQFKDGELWILCSPNNLDPIYQAKRLLKATGMRSIHFLIEIRQREVTR